MPIYTFSTLNGPAAGHGTIADGINDSGQISGTYYDQNAFETHGFLLSGGTYTTVDDPLGTHGDTTTRMEGINNNGAMVGYYYDASFKLHGFLYQGGTYTAIDDTSGVNVKGTAAYGVNDYNHVAGAYVDTNNMSHGFVEKDGLFQTFNVTIYGTTATGINNADQVVGYYKDGYGTSHGFLYDPNGVGFTTLNDPLAVHGTFALGINGAGQVVGQYVDGNNVSHGFFYRNGGYTTIDDPNAGTGSQQGTAATGINDSGQIVGMYYDSGGNMHGFSATPAAAQFMQLVQSMASFSPPAGSLVTGTLASAGDALTPTLLAPSGGRYGG
jgi:probable HAF family extracellular repeat protein